jgi:hypothetical protein
MVALRSQNGHSAGEVPGERSAMIYTLLGSCRRHGVHPLDYLKDLFTRLPAAKITQSKEFTPTAWAKAKEKMIPQAAQARWQPVDFAAC